MTFPDEVLQRAWEEGYDLFSHELINNFEAPDRTVVVAAMRAVLEGHLAAEHATAYGYLSRLFVHYAPQCEPLPTLDGLCTQIDNLLVSLAGAASDGRPR